ncbi:MAG: hypothetical protein AMXMBFR59_26360 [Rhodanobacteraceae bacterium]
MIHALSIAEIIRIHDSILRETGVGLPGIAPDKDMAGMLARVDNRLSYEEVDDLLYIAAFYAVAIATGHCFNDGNKRTGFAAMDVFLRKNGVTICMEEDAIVEMMVAAAAGQIGHDALADRIADHLYELYVEQIDGGGSVRQ